MPRTNCFKTIVEFGDCDPAQIVFYPNYFKWFDSGTRHFFVSCGFPKWPSLWPASGIAGAPLVDASAKFFGSLTYGEEITIETAVLECGGKSFTMRHLIRRGDTLLAEGREVRVFVASESDGRVRALPVPAEVRSLCADAKPENDK
jgi:4-hydroxybenzoyl-CoA thioesterase